MRNDLYLPIEVAGIQFKNPFYVASGPTTKSVKQLQRIEETGWAAASIKLTIDPDPYVNRVPRYALFNDRDALCFTAEKRLKFSEGLTLVTDAKKVLTDLILMANITYAGDQGTAGWVNMAKKFEDTGVDIIELNMCCPNMSYNLEISSGDENSSTVRTGASLGQQGDAVAEIVREIKKVVSIPVFVKLTPEGGQIARIAHALYAAGADAVGGTSNRLGIPIVNLDNPASAVYHLQKEISMSCHAGAWLKPLAQRDTYEMRKLNGPDVSIMQAGGVRNYKDAAELIMCGTDLVGICAETLISGFGFIEGLISELKGFMGSHGYDDLRSMRDLIVPEVKSALELTLYDGHARITKPKLAAPCKAACPHGVPAQAYVQMVAKGDFRRAYDLIMSKNPLQSVCGWVCNSPCEDACTRGDIGTTIPIGALKRFVLEYGKQQGWTPELSVHQQRPEQVAVIGSGPAGLACAYYLTLAGYRVTVFEKEHYLGGMLRYGLPRFRMNHQVLDEEIEMLTSLGIVFEPGKALGREISIEVLKSQGYQAIFLGIGATDGRPLNVPGEEQHGVLSAMSFLKDVYDGQDSGLGKKVVVIGGGFTAVDAARSAKRLGAEEVYIAYRRTKDEMPASAAEITEAEEEGIKVMYLVSPQSIEAQNGHVSGIHMINQVLGAADASNRRRPEAVPTADFTLTCDTVIAAIGQQSDLQDGASGLKLDEYGMLAIDPATGATQLEGVYAGGDVHAVDSVIAAIAAGKRAACSIDAMLAQDAAVLEYDPTEYPVVSKEAVLKRSGYFKDGPVIDLHTQDGNTRVTDFSIHVRSLTEEEAVSEAQRCLNCGCGEGCAICATLCPEFTILVDDVDTLGIHEDECVACGMCCNRCPNDNIEMVDLHVTV
ncbi:MAG: FAD-dependent oxidoreductase [bacterium]|nr:FAD-dependent oxidoreductase [bacterium]